MTQAPYSSPKPDLDTLRMPETTGARPRRGVPWGALWAAVVVVALVAVVIVARGSLARGRGDVGDDLLFTVARDDLRITVVESGSLESANSVDIKSALEGRAQILRLVDEGTFVKKGDLLVELDASDLIERETAQEISFEKAKASHIQAQRNFEIKRSDGESDIKQAELAERFAGIDLEKYKEGDWPQQQKAATSDITIAEEELKRARDKVVWSEKLADKGYISRQELEADKLNVTRREIDLDRARESLKVLQKYTDPKERERLESDLEEAGKELDRVRKRVDGEMAQAEADLKAKKATFDLETERLEKLRDQIRKARIVAPQDGLVVYNNQSSRMGRSSQEMIEEGATVRERQTIIMLPDTSNMIAKIKVHESAYNRVKEGQKALVRLDAFADKLFPARVSFLAPLPDSQAWWMNPDLKVYAAEIKLGGDTSMLKPGMSCSVEIEVVTLHDVLFVPIQAVFRKDKTSFCYVRTDAGVVARPVKVGLHNDRLIHVAEGLQEGDRVLLAAPPDAEKIEVPETEEEPGAAIPAEDEFPKVEPRRGDEPDVRADRGTGGGGFNLGSLADMSPEERAKAMQNFMKMSPEEQKKLRERMTRAYSDMSPGARERLRSGFGREGGASARPEGTRPEGTRPEGTRPEGTRPGGMPPGAGRRGAPSHGGRPRRGGGGGGGR